MNRAGGRRLVLLGMITKMPVPGVLWQTLHYLEGFRRLGWDVLYVEAHARTPSMFSRHDGDPGSRRAAAFLQGLFERFGFGDAWAFHALHDDGRCWGMERSALFDAYRSAEFIINLHGGTRPRNEHADTGRLVFLGTDPVQLEVELWQRRDETREFLDAHRAWFTFGENYGNPDCGLPVSEHYELHPTRQPVVLDFWNGQGGPDTGTYTTVANWRQPFRQIRYRKQIYHWSKDREFRKFLDLPSRSACNFELALSSYTPEDRALLESHGFRVRDAAEFSTEPDGYRRYVQDSRGEFTVAKDQNVRLRSGWFSDRSATYLAAGRPVLTQETGFSAILPTGEGLFGYDDMDGILAGLDKIEADYAAACRAARDVARECFDYRIVLSRLLVDLGAEGPARVHPSVAPGPVGLAALPPGLVLEPIGRRPLRLDPATERTLMERPWPTPRTGATTAAPTTNGASADPSADAPAVSIVMVTWEQLALTRLSLESLLTHGAHRAFEVVVVDNGSCDDTPAYLRALAAHDRRVRIVLNPDNAGFAEACNVGARIATGETLVFLNNDTVLAPGWLDRLVEHLDDPAVGAVNPVTNRIGTEAEVAASPPTYEAFLQFAARRLGDRAGEIRDVSMLAFFCLALRREIWSEVGPLDASFGRGLFEDDDYSMRLARAGYRLVCAEDVFVHHLGEASFGGLVADGTYARLFEENRRRFERKWGRTWKRRRRGPDEAYGALVDRVRAAVQEHVPDVATVAVVSRGDEALRTFERLRGWHFPRQADGVWAGFYPADDAEALCQLETVRTRGATYFAVPAPAFWWLEHYPALRRHLEQEGEELMRSDDLRLFRLREDAAPRPRPVFIIGSPRSGTSILTWSLGQHPNLYPLEETVWFERFYAGLAKSYEVGTSRADLSQISAQGIERTTFMQAFGQTIDRLVLAHRRWPENPVAADSAFARARAPDHPKQRWVDGTPQNSFCVDGLAELFPEARFIHLLREPEAVVRSLRRFHHIGGQRHTTSEAYARWLRHVDACLEAERALGPERALRVLHRDLAARPEVLLRSCLAFLDEPWSPDCLIPVERRINSSGTRPEPGDQDDADPALVAEAEALGAKLFGAELTGS
jgi:GT2 family glycosyltransferase